MLSQFVCFAVFAAVITPPAAAAPKPMRLCAGARLRPGRPQADGPTRPERRGVRRRRGELPWRQRHVDRLINVPDFPKADRVVDQAALGQFRGKLAHFKARGLKITISGGEPILPGDFFDKYPEARDVTTACYGSTSRTARPRCFRRIPEIDCIEFHLWEVPLLNDSDYFSELSWTDFTHAHQDAKQYYSPADYLTQLMLAFSRGHSRRASSSWF